MSEDRTEAQLPANGALHLLGEDCEKHVVRARRVVLQELEERPLDPARREAAAEGASAGVDEPLDRECRDEADALAAHRAGLALHAATAAQEVLLGAHEVDLK